MQNRLLIMGLALTLPLSSFAIGFGADNALEALTEFQQTALEKSSVNAGIEKNKAAQAKYKKEEEVFRANIKKQKTNISSYAKSQKGYSESIARLTGLKKSISIRQKINVAELATLRANIANKASKKTFIDTTKKEIQTISINNIQNTNKKRNIKAKLENLRNLQDSKGLNAKQANDLQNLNTEMAQVNATIQTTKTDIEAKRSLIAKTEAEVDNLKVPFFTKGAINTLEIQIQGNKDATKIYSNLVEAHSKKITELGKQQLAAQSDIETTDAKIKTNLKTFSTISGKAPSLELRHANESAKNALGHLLRKGENSKFKAELMFQSANDVLNNLVANGANREIMAEALKAQAARAIKKSVIGQYIEDQLASSRKQSCEEVAQCMNLQQLGISQSSLIKATPGSEAGPIPGKQPASLQEAE